MGLTNTGLRHLQYYSFIASLTNAHALKETKLKKSLIKKILNLVSLSKVE